METTARLVRPDVIGRRIEYVQVSWERTLGGLDEHQFSVAVMGASVRAVGRRAKWIVIELERDGEESGVILCHLRMSGRLVVDTHKCEQPYERVAVGLVDDRGRASTLRFLDIRKFGRFRFVLDPDEVLGDLGPEPLGPDFTADWFAAALKRRARALKPLLLDQTFLAGLGNIYVDESLFRAGLHPLRPANRVSRAKADALHAAIRETLAEAIEREGSSFDTFYRTPEGQPGSYQHLFQVYGRDGKACPRCGRTIVKTVVGQRGTHLCLGCQPRPRKRRVRGRASQ